MSRGRSKHCDACSTISCSFWGKSPIWSPASYDACIAQFFKREHKSLFMLLWRSGKTSLFSDYTQLSLINLLLLRPCSDAYSEILKIVLVWWFNKSPFHWICESHLHQSKIITTTCFVCTWISLRPPHVYWSPSWGPRLEFWRTKFECQLAPSLQFKHKSSKCYVHITQADDLAYWGRV